MTGFSAKDRITEIARILADAILRIEARNLAKQADNTEKHANTMH